MSLRIYLLVGIRIFYFLFSSFQIAKPPVNTPTKSIVATPLQPGQAIPPGTTVFMSGGKTYCIPKASMALATQPQQAAPTPALPVTPLPPQQLENTTTPTTTPTVTPAVTPAATPAATPATPQNATIGTVTAQTTGGQKQMVEVKSLGQNTVTFKGNQMIVSGPDVAQAQQIARQLSSGAAKLATLNGKQVLISTQPTVMNKTASPNATPQNSQPQEVVAPASTEIPNNVKLPSEPLPMQQQATTTPSTPVPVKAPEPAAPVTPQPTQVTAQLIQTPQGPRIVLQGIQGKSFF